MTTNATIVLDAMARAAGVTLTSEGRDALSSILGSTGAFQPGVPVTVAEGDGTSRPAVEWFADWLKRAPDFIAPTKPNKPTPPTGNRTERAIATNMANRSQESGTARALAVYHQFGNPWIAGRINRSHQGAIANADPALADRLREEAAL